jgi:hypothetical protein
MIYMTETKRPLVPRRRPLVSSGAMRPTGLPTAKSGEVVLHMFTLHDDASALGGSQIERRAFPRGEDS